MRDPLGRYLTNWRNRVVLPHIRGRFLDIGCGLNTLVRSYNKGDGIGVDVYQWGDVDVVVPDTSKLDFATGSFQTVTVIACLNHIPNRSAVLAEAYRVLEPGGRVIVTMIPPTLSRAWHFLRLPWDDDQSERGMKDGEVYGLTPSEVRRLLTESGFEIVLEQPFMARLNRLTVTTKPVESA